jgi:hypothetical protein
MVITQFVSDNTIHVLSTKEEWFNKHKLAESLMLFEEDGMIVCMSMLSTEEIISFVYLILTKNPEHLAAIKAAVLEFAPVNEEV